jgi:hypothetical protein
MLRIEDSDFFYFWSLQESADTDTEIGRKKDTNLANVDIASVTELRVVKTQDGHVQSIRCCNAGTCIIGLDNLGGRAILANTPEADGIARSEVRAIFVNDTGINRSQLVPTIAPQKKKRS